MAVKHGRDVLAQNTYLPLVLNRLGDTDDRSFWTVAMQSLLEDVEVELYEHTTKTKVYAQLGACSHWLRPHQTRWTEAGGFAWPSGYGGSGSSRLGRPEFDWSILLYWDIFNHTWQPVEKFSGKRRLLFRAALPTRTKQHDQATVHTLWSPGSPKQPKEKVRCFYGFRRVEGEWAVVAQKALNL